MDLNLSLNIVQGSSRDATKSEGKQKHKLKRKKLMEINERKKNRSGRLNKQRPNRSHATSNPIYSANFEKIKERRAQRKAGVIKDRDHLAQKAIQSEFDSGIVEEKLPKLSVIDKPASDRTESFEKVRNNQPTTSTRNQDRPTHSYGIFERTNKSRFNRDGGEDFARNGTKKSIKSSDREDKSLNKSSQPDEDILQSILGIANRSVPKESNHDLSVPNPTVGFEGLDEFSAGLDRPAKKRPMAGDRPVKKFLSEEEYFEKREREMEEEMSKLTDEDRNKLKNDFNRMFSNKGSIDYDAASFEVFKKPSAKPIQDTPRERRLSTVALFKNNPDIPEFTLPVLRKERKEGVFANKSFDEFEETLHPHLISCIKNKLNLTQMTTVQSEAIPKILTGKDCLIKSVTGSGKTLAILIPLVQILQALDPPITRDEGMVALIILPTRELVVQFYEPLVLLCTAFNRIVPGFLMGGENKHSEKKRLRKGINVLISTPGRLIDHLETTKSFSLEKLRYLVIDEADRLYESGFEESIKKIIHTINEAKSINSLQTILASATLTDGVKRLAGMLLEEAEFVDTCENLDTIDGQHMYTLPENLKQHYCVVPAKLRILTLTGFLFKHCSYEGSSKVLVFMSSQDVVDFHHTLFNSVLNPLLTKSDLTQITFFKLHGSMDQSERVQIFAQFRQAKNGVLLCTDVASRGVDLPHVDWVLQYSCSPTLEDYVHRVGRTARIDQLGQSLSIILPSEDNYIKLVQRKLKANLSELSIESLIESLIALDFSPKANSRQYREQAGQLQFVYESAVAQDAILGDLAKKAYISHTRSYASYPRALKDILPFKQLHLGHICKSFCLRESPRALGMSYKPAEPKERTAHPFNRTIRSTKRPIPTEFKTSEFDSGL